VRHRGTHVERRSGGGKSEERALEEDEDQGESEKRALGRDEEQGGPINIEMTFC
jgi:hypothetical protein